MNVSLTGTIILMVVSILLFMGCISVGMLYTYEYFYGDKREEMQKLSQYFRYNVTLTLFFNALCSLSCMLYFIWIVIDPLPTDTLYFYHESHNLRIVITVLSYVAKIFPFLIFNGRLKFAFTRGVYGTSTALFWTLNVIVLLLTVASLVIGYLGVFVYPNPVLIWIGFNLYRIIYILLLLLLSWLFNKRIFTIVSKRLNWGNYNIVKESTAASHDTAENAHMETDDDCECEHCEERPEEIGEIMEYLNIVIKSSSLLTFMILSKIIVMTAWFWHNLVTKGAHITLTIAFVAMSFDSLVDEICVVLLFKALQAYYARVCGCTRDETLQDIDKVHGTHSCYTRCCIACVECYSSKYVDNPNKRAQQQ